jgi:hypothetical protein
MHSVYVNSTGLVALKKGGPYPDKSTFVTDLHELTGPDGSYVEGARKAAQVVGMILPCCSETMAALATRPEDYNSNPRNCAVDSLLSLRVRDKKACSPVRFFL